MKTILIIEDDDAIRNGIADLLELEGYVTLMANDGKAGVDLALAHIPDVIISDIQMPFMDGYEALRILRQNSDTALIPFIFLTARATKEDHRKGMNIGADDYLTKPFEMGELLAAVNTCLEKQEAVEKNLDHLRHIVSLGLPQNIQEPFSLVIEKSKDLHDNLMTKPTAEIDELSGQIYKLGLELEHLVENYLLFTNVEVMKGSPERIQSISERELELSEALIMGYAQYRASLFERDSDVKSQIEDATIYIREDYFQKILEELVENVCRLSDKGSTILITGQRQNSMYQLCARCHGRTPDKRFIDETLENLDLSKYNNAPSSANFGLRLCHQVLKILGGYLNITALSDQHTQFEANFRLKQ